MLTEKTSPEQTENTQSLQALFNGVRTELGNKILGQQYLVDCLIIALLSDGHLLVEGAPGLAKTRAIKSLAELIDSQFHRVQFTPDLLPSDLTGTDVYQPQPGTFQFQKGPLFHNIILADEINRAPAKVQSALLEAMAERQITIGRTTHRLPGLFMVMATQNPIEQEGTYPLPEAQLDRFLMHIHVGYPAIEVESRIMDLARSEALQQLDHDLSEKNRDTVCIRASQIHQARAEILNLYLSSSMQEYIVQLVLASRNPGGYDETLGKWIDYGASPRGSIGLERVARAHAWLSGRDFVSPDDVQTMAHDVLRHRIILSFSTEAEGVHTDQVIDRLLELVPVP